MANAIIQFSRDFSPGVSAEMQALDALTAEQAVFARATTPEQYWRAGTSLAPYQYAQIFESLPKGSKILDVGVGFGQSSIFLADKGHQVYAVEPSLSMCRLIHEAANRFSLPVTVIQAVGEELSLIGATDFDVVIFNSSLHHCDRPVGAVAEAFKCLKPGGQLVLVNENMLKPWMSQARYLRLLEADPVGMGHYGGNEHAYHNNTYVKMLKTSFAKVDMLIPRMDSALDEVEMVLARRIGTQRIYSSNSSVLTRFVFYILKEKIRSLPGLYKLFARCSILPVNFRAMKKS